MRTSGNTHRLQDRAAGDHYRRIGRVKYKAGALFNIRDIDTFAHKSAGLKRYDKKRICGCVGTTALF